MRQRLLFVDVVPSRAGGGSGGSRFCERSLQQGLELVAELGRKRVKRQIGLDRRFETRTIIGFDEDLLPVRSERRHLVERAFDSSRVFGNRGGPRVRALLRLKSIPQEMRQHDREIRFQPSSLASAQRIELVRQLLDVERLPAVISEGTGLLFAPCCEVLSGGKRLRANTSGHRSCCNTIIFRPQKGR